MAAVDANNNNSSDDDMDDVPLAQIAAQKQQQRSSRLSRSRPRPAASKADGPARKKSKSSSHGNGTSKSRSTANGSSPTRKQARTTAPNAAFAPPTCERWWDSNDPDANNGTKWGTLVHHGVLFPPEYKPHGVPLLYDGQPVDLKPAAEEVATFYATKIGTDHVQKKRFNENFFEDFRAVLKGSSAYKVIKKLDKCDFSKIREMLDEEKERKKKMTSEEKKAKKEEERLKTEKFMIAKVDGRDEKIGNFRVEPPGLFLGRGEHPKMGRVKKRIQPEDVTINIGEDAPIPECPPGHKWGSVVHKHDVTWLAGWKDSITNGHKYVWLSAGSTFKGMSDSAKFEKCRKLKLHIDKIRREYEKDWNSKNLDERQRAVAMYLIDKLALRAGNEKGEDEADTVGCCSLRVEHIKFLGDNRVEFDFLGKDSIRYLNEVEVHAKVYKNLKVFCKDKEEDTMIFDRLSVTGLNDYLKSFMPGLSAKVFRTYNASITLSALLEETNPNDSVTDKIVFYNKSNKEVAILCNHQRAQPKAHGTQMEKLGAKVDEIKAWIKELERAARAAERAGDGTKVLLHQLVAEKPEFTPEMTDEQKAKARKHAQEQPKVKKEILRNANQIDGLLNTAKGRLAKLKGDMTVKEELKTVALGTSKINYLDPRITVAWCKKYEVHIEKIFAKTLLVKFAWAMEASEDFKF